MQNNCKFINVDIERNFTLRPKITHILFGINIDNLFTLLVLRCEVTHCQLAPLFAYILSNFLELFLNGRSERLAKAV